jgi:DNA-binding MarR family transcriptional regulator
LQKNTLETKVLLAMKKMEIIHGLFRVVALLEKSGNEIFAFSGLTTRLASVLLCIRDGVNKNTDLCKFLEGSPSAVTQKLALLEKKGLIMRKKGEIDKREYYFFLTKEGEQALQKCFPIYDIATKKLFESIPHEEVSRFLQTLQKLEKRLFLKVNHSSVCSFL